MPPYGGPNHIQETTTSTLAESVVLLQEKHLEMIDKCSQLVGSEKGVFSRARLEITVIAKQALVFTSFSFTFFVVISNFNLFENC